MKASLFLDRQSETAYRTYRVYEAVLISGADDHTFTSAYAGKVIQHKAQGPWFSGDGDTHKDGHRTRAQAVSCLLRRVSQPKLAVRS